MESIESDNSNYQKEKKRVQSYCLMRINDVMEHLNQSEGSKERVEEYAKSAKELRK